ncbi:MAG: metallophosphoesterase family protein, partial [Firmicutes bacterium]|nr:metallophosphoesterase family protein [Bacillota bacterium]
RTVFITHGHIYNNDTPPKLKKGDILLHGHTHIQAMEEINGYTYINPGSVSIPKNGNKNSYMIFSDNTFTIKDFDSNEIMSYKI